MHRPTDPGLVAALHRAARDHAPRPYLIAFDEAGTRREWTYRDFFESALRLARVLQDAGLAAGDRVATVSHNRPEVLLAYFACWSSGMTACPINVEEPVERKREILARAGCKAVLVESEFVDEIERAATGMDGAPVIMPMEHIDALTATAEPVAPRDLPRDTGAFLVFTSGTTGHPKGVLLDHGNLLSNASATAAWHGLAPGDGIMTVLPIHHVNGAIVTGLTSFLSGGRNILNRRFSPRTFWQRLASEKAALASMVPTLLEFLLSHDEDLEAYDLRSVRYLLCGAGPLLAETVCRFEDRFGVPICHGFGMSETTAYNTQFPMDLPDAERRRWYTAHGYPSVGCAIACNEVTVLRDDGSETGPLERGQIAIRGPTVMKGYTDDPEANAQGFRDGWFLSGDQGFFDVDSDGRRFFFLSGRLKELIVRGGVNISPLDIDDALRRYPGVRFALAVPFENVAYGEEIAAYVVPAEGAEIDEAELLAFARRHLPFASAPKVVVLGHDVPFTTTGKPRRVALAAQLGERLAPYRNVQFREPRRGQA